MRTIKPFGHGVARDSLRISLCDRNPDVARALVAAFLDVGGVEVLEGDLLDLDCDAVVSPANSFGYMDGGIDHHIDRFYDGDAQRRVLALITERFYGELPVGSATIVEMGNRRFPFLVVAPTMRVPGDDLAGTIHAYLAMRAAFIAVLDFNRAGPRQIGTLAVPGLGTGVGGMAHDESARQMRAAHDMIIAGGWRTMVHPSEAPFVMRRGGAARMMDLLYVRQLVNHLQGRGIRFEPGLTDAEVERVERRFGWLFPGDLLMLLQYALPISKRFPNWRSGREETLRESLAWPEEGLLFSVEHGDLWLDSWGERPSERADSLRLACHAVRRAPTLIPVYSHRYLPAEPMLPNNPVFSVYGADTIVYGNDLADYFHHEFEMPLPDWAAPSPRPIPFWTELVG